MPEGAKSLVLLNVYPNPFRERTVISYQLPVTGKSKEPTTEVVWNGRDIDGKEVESGVYFLRAKGYKPVKVIKLR